MRSGADWVLVGELKETDHFENLSVDGKIISKFIVRKCVGVVLD